jgi:septum formation protein
VPFEVRASGVQELEHGDPGELTLANARRKASAVARPGEVVVGCDTIVALEGRVYGKPVDAGEAERTLRALSGRTHEVVSGLVVLSGDVSAQGAGEPGSAACEQSAVARTEVTFRELSREQLEWYVALGEWRDRAGAYAIQGAGAALVRGLRGGYENVVGLPLAELIDLCPSLLVRG